MNVLMTTSTFPLFEDDGLPTVLAEALFAGCKVVTSRVGGVPDVLEDGRNGWLAAPGDPADLAAKLTAALDDTNEAIQQSARQTAQKLDWSRVAEKYLAHFETAVATNPRSSFP